MTEDKERDYSKELKSKEHRSPDGTTLDWTDPGWIEKTMYDMKDEIDRLRKELAGLEEDYKGAWSEIYKQRRKVEMAVKERDEDKPILEYGIDEHQCECGKVFKFRWIKEDTVKEEEEPETYIIENVIKLIKDRDDWKQKYEGLISEKEFWHNQDQERIQQLEKELEQEREENKCNEHNNQVLSKELEELKEQLIHKQMSIRTWKEGAEQWREKYEGSLERNKSLEEETERHIEEKIELKEQIEQLRDDDHDGWWVQQEKIDKLKKELKDTQNMVKKEWGQLRKKDKELEQYKKVIDDLESKLDRYTYQISDFPHTIGELIKELKSKYLEGG